MSQGQDVLWHWHSVQGAACTENRDACGVYQCAAYTFSVVMDAAPRGLNGVRFNATWLSKVLEQLGPEVPSEPSLLAIFQEAQKHLRAERLFDARASYIATVVPPGAKSALVFSCGDCSLGFRSPDRSIEWLTKPHTLLNAYEELGLRSDASKRHIVTQTLNATKFKTPTVSTVTRRSPGSWVLATDGYRYADNDDPKQPVDDCSFLLVGTELQQAPESAHANLFVRAR
jgi:hypothetical protein